MKLGDKMDRKVEWTECEVNRMGIANTKRHLKATGTVVYIHPLRRYYTLRFDLPGGSFRECFPC